MQEHLTELHITAAWRSTPNPLAKASMKKFSLIEIAATAVHCGSTNEAWQVMCDHEVAGKRAALFLLHF